LGFARFPKGLSREKLESVPEKPGVYMFYSSKGDIPLYIGKGKNLKERISQHFSGKINSKKELKLNDLTDNLEFIETSGEFSALMLESKLIKEKKPLLNKRLRDHKIHYTAKLIESKDGLLVPTLFNFESLEDLVDSIGIFKSKKDFDKLLTRLSKDYNLCQVALGIEKSQGSCFNYQLEKCNGVCTMEESIKVYNQRLKSAFRKHEIKPWNFEGKVLLEENNVYHLVDKWCYLTKIESESDLEDALNTSYEYNFDYDQYLIMKKFLNGNYNYKVVSGTNSFDL